MSGRPPRKGRAGGANSHADLQMQIRPSSPQSMGRGPHDRDTSPNRQWVAPPSEFINANANSSNAGGALTRRQKRAHLDRDQRAEDTASEKQLRDQRELEYQQKIQQVRLQHEQRQQQNQMAAFEATAKGRGTDYEYEGQYHDAPGRGTRQRGHESRQTRSQSRTNASRSPSRNGGDQTIPNLSRPGRYPEQYDNSRNKTSAAIVDVSSSDSNSTLILIRPLLTVHSVPSPLSYMTLLLLA